METPTNIPENTTAARFLNEVKVIPLDALSAPHRYWEVQAETPPRGLITNDPIIDDLLFFL